MIVELKSDKEIEGFKRAGYETGRILDILVYNATIGQTGIELNNIAISECKKIDAEPIFLNYRGFPAAICVSKNSTLVHGIPDNEPFQKGDIISIDFGLSLDGFIGDAAKTVEIKHNVEVIFTGIIYDCEYALKQAIKIAKPNNRLSDIGRVIENEAKENGFRVPREYGGHGISRNVLHAAPFIPNYYTRENDMRLHPGMVLAIEPMFIDATSNKLIIEDDGWTVKAQGNTAHFEHTILITDNEPIVLTQSKEG